MKLVNERNLIRVLHLVLSVPILGYLYGPVASIPRTAGVSPALKTPQSIVAPA